MKDSKRRGSEDTLNGPLERLTRHLLGCSIKTLDAVNTCYAATLMDNNEPIVAMSDLNFWRLDKSIEMWMRAATFDDGDPNPPADARAAETRKMVLLQYFWNVHCEAAKWLKASLKNATTGECRRVSDSRLAIVVARAFDVVMPPVVVGDATVEPPDYKLQDLYDAIDHCVLDGSGLWSLCAHAEADDIKPMARELFGSEYVEMHVPSDCCWQGTLDALARRQDWWWTIWDEEPDFSGAQVRLMEHLLRGSLRRVLMGASADTMMRQLRDVDADVADFAAKKLLS